MGDLGDKMWVVIGERLHLGSGATMKIFGRRSCCFLTRSVNPPGKKL